jgi:hypothetical protein
MRTRLEVGTDGLIHVNPSPAAMTTNTDDFRSGRMRESDVHERRSLMSHYDRQLEST